jgi:hypothetical protein
MDKCDKLYFCPSAGRSSCSKACVGFAPKKAKASIKSIPAKKMATNSSSKQLAAAR